MVYIGGIYEKNLNTGEVTKYYHTADGRRLAMRKGSTLYWFANDHLGGTAVVMNDSGGLVSRTRYYPYGNAWTQENTSPTDRMFTGQRRYGQKSGMNYYGARFYSADIGRFLSPDSIVPGAGDPQKWWEKLNELNLNPRLDEGHPGTIWKDPHINVNVDGRNVHIPVDQRWRPK